ncbi:MAG TPA: zinc ABC transporter substrate-binding protein [Actinomycetota bacterium]|nr:zinc ABC transporter substrate-binding protein [Actinomycetota bacterium]
MGAVTGGARTAAAALAVLALATSCGRAEGLGRADVSGRRVRVVATTGMIADVATNVGGGRVDVVALMGPGVDPHLYKASEGDVTTLVGADVIFYNGLHLEAAMADVLERARDRIRTVSVTDGIARDRLLAPPEFEGAYDPHVWFDVALWIEAAERVRAALAQLDPEHAGVYATNARAYVARLEELDEYVRRRVAQVPESARVLITAHDAFNYFGRAYGFDVRGLQGISTAAETGTADVSALADFIVERRIPAMFVESSVSPRFVEAVREAVRARDGDVAIGGSLYSDAMGTPGTPDGTYVGMVRHNVDTIAGALTPGGSP